MSARPALAKLAIAKRDLRLDDETYRAVLERVTGKRSAKDLDDAAIGRVLDDFKTKGWKPTVISGSATPQPVADNKKGRRRAASHPAAGKARALWISLHQLGVVRDPRETALEAFARRQLGVDRLEWADQGLVYKLIEALKAMANRAGWDQDVAGVEPRLHVRLLKLRLARAQDKILRDAGHYIEAPVASLYLVREADLDHYSRSVGELVRTIVGRAEP